MKKIVNDTTIKHYCTYNKGHSVWKVCDWMTISFCVYMACLTDVIQSSLLTASFQSDCNYVVFDTPARTET